MLEAIAGDALADTVDVDEDGTHWLMPKGRPLALVVLVHGAFSTGRIWAHRLMPALAEAGYATLAPSFQRRADDGRAQGLRAFTRQVHSAVTDAQRRYPDLPVVLVGHSMGAVVAQQLWRPLAVQGLALMAPVPPEGMWSAALRLGLLNPRLSWSLAAAGYGIAPSQATMRAALFAAETDARIAAMVHSEFVAESLQALADVQVPQPVHCAGAQGGCPVLVLGALGDQLIPPDGVARVAYYHRTRPQMLRGLGHAMMVDARWADVVAALLAWLSDEIAEARAPADQLAAE